jgi:hypothetical protein
MKKIIISTIFICSVIFINAQLKNNPTFNEYLQKKGIFSPGSPKLPSKPRILVTPGIERNLSTTSPLQEAKPSYTLENGSKVYLLPQDNMPCVVPDMSQFNMPVVKADLKGFIPNGSRLFRLIPQ